jgi:hypothetical protein
MKNFRRSLKSATAPAGKVRKKNGKEAAVAISDKSSGEAPEALISQVAAVSCADTQTPEMMLASQRPRKTRFLSASHTEVSGFVLSALEPILNMALKGRRRIFQFQ